MLCKRICVLFVCLLVCYNVKALTIINPRGPVSFRCLDCICDTVSECNLEPICVAGDACGAYRITPTFWLDAGCPVLSGDDVEHEDAFVNCAIDKKCSEKAVQGYMEKNKRDCNGDGMVDCKDFFALHILGSSCNKTLHENFEKRFMKCDQPNKIVPAIPDNKNFFLPNYDSECAQCLCEAASGCNKTIGCEDGYCGIYRISKPYWMNAGRPVIAGDDPDRRTAFEDCVFDQECAEKTVKQYLMKFGRDCNGDSVTSCTDYLMIHFSEGLRCNLPVDQEWVDRYHKCWLAKNEEDPPEEI